MRIAMVADIHSNAYALDAVVTDAETKGVHRFWSLGDVVGYGPHPVRCLEFLRDKVQKSGWVLGNHDAVFVGLLRLPYWRKHAAEALALNREAVVGRPGLERWCKGAFTDRRCGPIVRDYQDDRYVLLHGSLLDPLSDYLFPWYTAYKIPKELERLRHRYMGSDERPVSLCHGHTHIPALYSKNSPVSDQGFVSHTIALGEPMRLGEAVSIINPGSVGQPRDGDQRAAYCILDTRRRTVEYRRVQYDHMKTIRDLRRPVRYPDLVQRILREALVPSEAPAGWFTECGDCGQRTTTDCHLISPGQTSARFGSRESSHVS
jgi:predicted phosphodiesterase